MTLTIHQEEDEQRQLKVTVEVAESRVQDQINKLIRRLSREVQIPGFRRGKVPRNVLIQRIGEDALRAEAIEEMVEPLIKETFEEINTEEIAYYQPSLDEMTPDPLVLKFNIPLEPVVKLGDYRSIRRELEPVEVTDEMMEDAVNHIRSHHQVLEEVDRPAEAGDMLTASGSGWIIGEDGEDEGEFWHVHDTKIILDPEESFPGLPIVENLIGLSAGEEKTFTFTFPEDYEEEELAGKEARMEISAELVQSRFLPELDDELVQKEGDYETVEEFLESLREEIYEQEEERVKAELMGFFVDEMVEDVEMVYPPAAVDNELDRMAQSVINELKQYGWDGDEEEIRKDLGQDSREHAVTNVRQGLTVRQFVTEEKIKVTDADIDEAMADRLDKFEDNEELREQLRSIFMQGKSFETMQQNIIEEKLYDRMKAIVTGNAPDLASLEEEEEALTEDEEE